jgi:hypothetical protein
MEGDQAHLQSNTIWGKLIDWWFGVDIPRVLHHNVALPITIVTNPPFGSK